MINLEHCKLQIGCFLVIVYLIINYLFERRNLSVKKPLSFFDAILAANAVYLVFDGLTAYFVNYPEKIPMRLNLAFHAAFLLIIDFFMFMVLVYMISLTYGLRFKKWIKPVLAAAFIVESALIVSTLGFLRFEHGKSTNYSMGIPVYICYFMIALYIVVAAAVFIIRGKGLEKAKRISIITFMVIGIVSTSIQCLFPETLISGIAITIITVGIYLNLENPALEKVASFQSEMVMGFATLIEKRDDSTGGHVRRTAKYVELIAKEMRRRGIYRDELTHDFISRLVLAAPMHDIGKISIPDEILRKPGKLTDDEYDIMKSHSAEGGNIIKETFRYLDSDYAQTAFQVARYHHEKWNGRGYPDNLKRLEIPLCARIMAVADVFDAVSEKRCYREAMSIDKCFSIIEKGSGEDFDPAIVKVFLELRAEVENIHKDEMLRLSTDKGF